jgi:ABC-type dipeptide/oligopeptide/nickel transport systems, permease components
MLKTLQSSFREIKRYPSAVIGTIIIILMMLVAVYTLIAIPYNKAITLWRGGEDVWYMNPKFAPPAWTNWFKAKKEPVSFSVDTEDKTLSKEVKQLSPTSKLIKMSYTFDFNADSYPQDLMLYFNNKYQQKMPFVNISLITPAGKTISVDQTGVSAQQNIRFSQISSLITHFENQGGLTPMEGLFSNQNPKNLEPAKGKYTLVISGTTFEKDSDIDVQFVFFGTVYGAAGTDMNRRDLMIPLLWGTPVALLFGLVGSLGTLILTMIIAAIGAWYGGWVDGLIQRITEINLVLPYLPILIMIGTFFSRSIWVILGTAILLNIFTGQIKSYRAIFMQIRESGYIEAAKVYGASNFRIIFKYLIPRMIPLLIPGLVSSVPSFVFLEASLAVLGLGDPVLPTWGKMINDADVNGALYKGYYYWMIEPAVLLMVTGLGFAMLGFALDRVFNPKLREM